MAIPAAAAAAYASAAKMGAAAPMGAAASSAVPANLATSFAAATLATGALFWLIVGPLFGWLNERFARSSAFALKGAHA